MDVDSISPFPPLDDNVESSPRLTSLSPRSTGSAHQSTACRQPAEVFVAPPKRRLPRYTCRAPSDKVAFDVPNHIQHDIRNWLMDLKVRDGGDGQTDSVKLAGRSDDTNFPVFHKLKPKWILQADEHPVLPKLDSNRIVVTHGRTRGFDDASAGSRACSYEVQCELRNDQTSKAQDLQRRLPLQSAQNTQLPCKTSSVATTPVLPPPLLVKAPLTRPPLPPPPLLVKAPLPPPPPPPQLVQTPVPPPLPSFAGSFEHFKRARPSPSPSPSPGASSPVCSPLFAMALSAGVLNMSFAKSIKSISNSSRLTKKADDVRACYEKSSDTSALRGTTSIGKREGEPLTDFVDDLEDEVLLPLYPHSMVPFPPCAPYLPRRVITCCA